MTKLPYPALPIPNDWDRKGLPAWTYHSPALFALEREKVFLTHWQVVGHECDLPAPGDWLAFDLLGVTVSVGHRHFALAVGIGADFFALGTPR